MQKMANKGPLRASIVGPTQGGTQGMMRVVFSDATGKAKDWELPNVSNNGTQGCCCFVQDRLIVATRSESGFNNPNFFKTVVTEFKLPDDPFSAPPDFVIQHLYGDSDSRGSELLLLKSGEVVSVTYQHTDMRVCASVRGTGGVWRTQGLFKISDEDGTAHHFSMAAAPWAENEIWVFDTLDGGNGVACGVFTVTGGTLALKKTIPVLVPTGIQPWSEWNINGELAALIATTDAARNEICLSYTNIEFGNVHQTALPVVIGIHQDATWHGITKGTEFIVSIHNTIPIVVNANGVAIDYLVPGGIFVVGKERIPTRDGQFAWNQYAQEFIYSQPDTVDANGNVVPGNLVLTILIPGPTPIPPPQTENVVASIMCSLSWSGADPTGWNASIPGKFWLQGGPSAAGPWQNITDHWPISVQGKEAVPMAGPVVKVGDVFYRITPRSG